MKIAPKLTLGIFAAIGIFVVVKLVESTVNISDKDICHEVLHSTFLSPNGMNNITVEHMNCSITGSKSSVLLGKKDNPNHYAVLWDWKDKTYENNGFSFFPPPVAIKWYSNNEVYIMVPSEIIKSERSVVIDGVKVKYYSLNPLTIN